LPIFAGKGMRQLAEPLPQQPVNLLGRQTVAERLNSLGIVARQDAVIQRLIIDASVGQLLLDVLVTVQAELGIVGKVRAELTSRAPGEPL
jgi:hypothetical protein